MSTGLFSPHSVLWRVNRETLTGLARARALMLELAHPLVAAGVAQYSDFRRDPFGRLYRTMRAANDITFGNAEAADRAAGHIRRCHQRVRGSLRFGVGSLDAGTRYDANDPELKVWVLATLTDSVLRVYDLFVRPLSLEERRAYYRDSLRLAPVFDIPPAVLPATYEDFTAYVDAMVAGDILTVSDSAREIVEAVFAPPLVGSLARLASFAGIGLLPPRIRAGYGFSWSDRHERLLQRVARVCRRVRPLVPTVLCVSPRAVIAELRAFRLNG